MKILDASKILEVEDVHPRVAYQLEMSNWCYLHEYGVRGGFIDFVAIRRDTHQLAIIECKRAISNVGELVYQLSRYHDSMRVKAALKVAFTLKPPSKDAVRRLKAANILCYGIDLDMPSVTEYPSNDAQVEFASLLKRYHVIEPVPEPISFAEFVRLRNRNREG